jgi:hypothetical protein
MGSVYLAERIEDGRRVAVKLLVPELARTSAFAGASSASPSSQPASTTRTSFEHSPRASTMGS